MAYAWRVAAHEACRLPAVAALRPIHLVGRHRLAMPPSNTVVSEVEWLLDLNTSHVDPHMTQALIAKNQLSWDVVMRPEQVVNVGDIVKARVSYIDQKNARVNLSLKQMTVRLQVKLQIVTLSPQSHDGVQLTLEICCCLGIRIYPSSDPVIVFRCRRIR